MQTGFSAYIEPDLEAIADYIANDNPTRALTFIQEIRKKVQVIAHNPYLYQLRPEIAPNARLAVVGRYILLFQIKNETVRFERILYGGIDLVELLQE